MLCNPARLRERFLLYSFNPVWLHGGEQVVAAPLYKQHYCLNSGDCVEQDASLKTWQVRVEQGTIQLAG